MKIFNDDVFDRYEMAKILESKMTGITKRCVIEVEFDVDQQLFIVTAEYSDVGVVHSYSIEAIEAITWDILTKIVYELAQDLGREFFVMEQDFEFYNGGW